LVAPSIPSAATEAEVTVLDLEAEADHPGVVDYEPASLRLRGPAAEFHQAPTSRIASALEQVLASEAPLHLDQAARRVAVAWGITRSTTKVQDRIEEAAAALVGAGKAERRGEFMYTASGAPVAVRRPAGGIQRDIDEIAPEELAACVLLVVDAYLGIARDALVKEVSRVLGYQRLGEKIQAVLEPVVLDLLDAGVLIADEDRLRRPPAPAPDATPATG
jgi:hypothetical protein